MSSYSIFNSCYLNNKVTCEKFDVLLYATFGRSLDVQISPLSTRLQWTEKGRPMDVQYGTWTDGPNKDVLWTSFGRAMPIGSEDVLKTSDQNERIICLSHTSSEDVFKTSSRCLHKDQYIGLGRTSSRSLQDYSKCLQDVLQKHLQDIFKTFCKDVSKTFSRLIGRLNCLPRSRICLGHTSEKFMVSVENLLV